MIKRIKTTAAITTDTGYGTHGRRMGVRTVAPTYRVVLETTTVQARDRNGRPTRVKRDTRTIGELDGKFYRHRFAAPDGKRYSLHGTWTAIRKKLDAAIYGRRDPNFPLVRTA